MIQKKKNINVLRDSIVINSAQGNECRVAIVRDGRLDELHVERVSSATNVGNIYRGRVVNIESSIQAVFVDYGEGENGFLHISDVHPRYFLNPKSKEKVGKKVSRKERPPIQDVFNKGDEVLVQVLKEGVGGKGPSLTSYISMPGRYIVMMPYMDKIGLSRRIEDQAKRREMKKILDTLNLPKGSGFILRTAGFGRSKIDLKRDVAYLMRMWKVMQDRKEKTEGPCQLYSESDVAFRVVRDLVREDMNCVYVDTFQSCKIIRSFLSLVSPRSAPEVFYYSGLVPIFQAFGIEKDIKQLQSREVSLASGGRLVIDQTEALVSIDVNSGKSRSASTSEENATKTNLEAAVEICRQLKLRDLGGLVVCDFIDMGKVSNRKKVEQAMSQFLTKDRASTHPLPINKFGLLVLTRQRIHPSIDERDRCQCQSCHGRGTMIRPEVLAGEAIRKAAWVLDDENVFAVEIACSGQVASAMLGSWREPINQIELRTSKKIIVRVSDGIEPDRFSLFAYDGNGADIPIMKIKLPRRPSDEILRKELKKPRSSNRQQFSKAAGESVVDVPVADATDIALINDLEEEMESLDKKKKPVVKKKQDGGSPASRAIRVYQLAKDLGLTSKELLDQCKRDSRLNLRSHASSISSDLVSVIKSLVSSSSANVESKAKDISQQGRRKSAKKRVGASASSKKISSKKANVSNKKVKKRAQKKADKKKDNDISGVSKKTDLKTKKKRVQKKLKGKESDARKNNTPSKRRLYATRRRVTSHELQDRNKEGR